MGPVQLAAPIPGAEQAHTVKRFQDATGIRVHALAAAGAARSSWGRKLTRWVRGHSELLERRWVPESAQQVHDLVKLLRPDCLVADSTFVLPLLPRRDHLPLLLHLHNVESALLGRHDDVPRPLPERVARAMESFCIARTEAAAVRRARLTITVSELDRQRVLGLVPDARVIGVENSVDVTRIPLLPPHDQQRDPTLLFVGTFDYPPNLEAAEDLIEHHLPALRAEWPRLEILLVGLDSGGRLERHRGTPGLQLLGRVDDLRAVYERCTAIYLPIHSGGGTRIKVLEAFAFGRPVLSTAVGVEGLGLVPDTHYCAFESPQEGVAALRRLRAHDAGPMLQAARDLVERRYSHTQTRQRLAAMIAEHFLGSGGSTTRVVVPPLSRTARLFSRIVGRPAGVAYLLARRVVR